MNRRIRHKLALISFLFLLPLAFVIVSLVTEKNKAIDFAQKEVAGNHLLTLLREFHVGFQAYIGAVEVIRQGGQAATAAPDDALRQRLQAIVVAKDEFAAVAVDDDSIAAFLTPAEALWREAPTNNSMEKVRLGLRNLIVRVGDGSNLILDPDLDSYYAMSVVLLRSPELLDRIGQLSRRGQALTGVIGASEDRIAFVVARGELSATQEGLVSDVAAGYRGNPDGSLKPALDAVFKQTVAALNDFTRAAGTAANGGGDKRAGAAFRQAALDQVASFTAATAAQLDRLLSIRIQGFYRSMAITLAIAGAIVLLTILVVVWVSRDISRGVVSIAAAMDRIAAGDTGIEIPCRERLDEIGEMAKATKIFQDNLVSKLQLEAEAGELRRLQLERQQAERATEVRIQQDLAAVVDAVAAGDFTRRLSQAGAEGLAAKLATGIDRLAATISSALSEVMQMMSGLARGDLSKRITGIYEGDLLRLQRDCNATADQLAHVVGQTVHGMETIRTATAQLTTGASDLSVRTEQQVANSGGDGGGDPPALGDNQAECGKRRSGEPAGDHNPAGGGRRRECRGLGGGGHEPHRGVVAAHWRNRRHDRRDRVPDEPSGVECGGGSGACRRSGAGFCGGGFGSAGAGATVGRSVERDQSAGGGQQREHPGRRGSGQSRRQFPV